MKAIVYTSNTGSAASYAALLSDKTARPLILWRRQRNSFAQETKLYTRLAYGGRDKGVQNRRTPFSRPRRVRRRHECDPAIGRSPVREQNCRPRRNSAVYASGEF